MIMLHQVLQPIQNLKKEKLGKMAILFISTVIILLLLNKWSLGREHGRFEVNEGKEKQDETEINCSLDPTYRLLFDWENIMRPCENDMSWLDQKTREKRRKYRTRANKTTIIYKEHQTNGKYSTILIQTFTANGEAKNIGGDSWQARLRGPVTQLAFVFDRMDGTYEVMFKIYTKGRYTLELTLEHSLCDGLRDPPLGWFEKGDMQGHSQAQGILGEIDDYLLEKVVIESFEIKYLGGMEDDVKVGLMMETEGGNKAGMKRVEDSPRKNGGKQMNTGDRKNERFEKLGKKERYNSLQSRKTELKHKSTCKGEHEHRKRDGVLRNELSSKLVWDSIGYWRCASGSCTWKSEGSSKVKHHRKRPVKYNSWVKGLYKYRGFGKRHLKYNIKKKRNLKYDGMGKRSQEYNNSRNISVKYDNTGERSVKYDKMRDRSVKYNRRRKRTIIYDGLGKASMKYDATGKTSMKYDSLEKRNMQYDSSAKNPMKYDSLWIYGDSICQRWWGSRSRKSLCKKLFKFCTHTYTFTYVNRKYNISKINVGLPFNHTKFLVPINKVLHDSRMTKNSVLVINFGIHLIMGLNMSELRNIVDEFAGTMNRIRTSGSKLPHMIWKTTTFSRLGDGKLRHRTHARFLTNQRIMLFNAYANWKLCGEGVSIFDEYTVSASYPKRSVDGLHYLDGAFLPAEKGLENFLIKGKF
eukprot:Seg3010.1 transcript_id=Seg3010.1/GoldUCD/mRNA.D3Y31 product="hypothetical protein" protein_id=Seg3010.1/GoldUCD/D3Y31